MATFFWKGQPLDAQIGWSPIGPYGGRDEEARGMPVQLLNSASDDRKRVSWNNPDNWYVGYQGLNPFTGVGGSADEQFLGDWYLVPATTAPGGGDTVYFERYDWAGVSWPQSPCLYGGHWGTDGWLNASNTGGKASVIVNPNFGLDNTWLRYFEEYYGSTTRVGVKPDERSFLVNNAQYPFGYLYAGATMTGLKLNLDSLTIKANQRFDMHLVQSNIDAVYAIGRILRLSFEGGTLGDVIVDGRYYNNDRGLENLKTIAAISIRPDSYYDSIDRTDTYVTGNVIVENIQSDLEYSEFDQEQGGVVDNPCYGGLSLNSFSTIKNVVVNTPVRPLQLHFYGNIQNFYSYPEKVRTLGDNLSRGFGVPEPYNSIRISAWEQDYNTVTVKNLYIRSTPQRTSLTLDDVRTLGYPVRDDPYFYVGVNNMVGVDSDCTIENILVDSGKFVLGTRRIDGNPSTDLIVSQLKSDDNVVILNGRIGSNGIMDLNNPDDSTFKGVVLGTGDWGEGTGIEILNSNAVFLPPRQSRIKLDFESTDITFDIDPTRPETFPRI